MCVAPVGVGILKSSLGPEGIDKHIKLKSDSYDQQSETDA